jgi:hypothetical protein
VGGGAELKKELGGLGISSVLPIWEVAGTGASGDGLGGGTLKFGSLDRMLTSICGCLDATDDASLGLAIRSGNRVFFLR